MESTIYKIVDKHVWAKAKAEGHFAGAAIDLQDGYIHLSTAEQVSQTLAKHFAGQDDLLLVAVSVAAVAKDLKWETSRNDQLFPHLYRPLKNADILQEQELPMNSDGSHRLPSQFRQSEQS